MVAQQKGEQYDSRADERFQRIRREVFNLPTAQLSILLRDIADCIEQQTGANAAATHLFVSQQSVSQQATPNQTIFDELMTMALHRDELSTEEQKRLRRMSYDAIMSLPPLDEPPPNDEEVKRMLHEHRIEKYGR